MAKSISLKYFSGSESSDPLMKRFFDKMYLFQEMILDKMMENKMMPEYEKMDQKQVMEFLNMANLVWND